MKFRLILLITFLTIHCSLFGQDDFLSRVYFPNTYGYNFPIENKHLDDNFMVSIGMELRANNEQPWFLRLSIESFRIGYEIKELEQTNVVKSQLRLNGFATGVGYRTGSEKWRFVALPQVWICNYKYPRAIIDQNVEVQFKKDNSISFGAVTGLEYYLARDIAFVVEAFYFIVPSQNSFWDKNFQNVGIRFGMTTSFF